jgi:sarcosine oxidase
MAPPAYDVIVAGLGAMGSATAWQLARRGRRVLALERWRPGHHYGSSHGDSRIIREIYFEDPLYVPIVRRAYELWRELEARTGRTLLVETGGLMLGPPGSEIVAGTLRAADAWRMPHDVLSAAELHRRYPAFDPPPDHVAVLDRRAGYLRPEACNAAHLQAAAHHGADIRFEEPLLAWQPDGGGIRATTLHGTYAAGALVLTVGARTAPLVPDLRLPLTVERQVLHWFDPGPADRRYDRGAFPIFIYGFEGARFAYGFPRLEAGVKAAIMHEGDTVRDPDRVNRAVGADESAPLRRALARVLPGLAGCPIRESTVCLFTNMPDGHFLIDRHPAYPQLLVSSPCSGHGFKFASAIGEIQADLLTDGVTRFDISPFRLRS